MECCGVLRGDEHNAVVTGGYRENAVRIPGCLGDGRGLLVEPCVAKSPEGITQGCLRRVARKSSPAQFNEDPVLLWTHVPPFGGAVDIAKELFADVWWPGRRGNAGNLDKDEVLGLEESSEETFGDQINRILRDDEHTFPVVLDDVPDEGPHLIPEDIVDAGHENLELR